MYFYGYRQHQPHAFVSKLTKPIFIKGLQNINIIIILDILTHKI